MDTVESLDYRPIALNQRRNEPIGLVAQARAKGEGMKTEWMPLGSVVSGAPPSAVQAALDALDCQIAVLSATGDVVAVNDAWRQMAESDVECATHVSPGQNYV